jgi:hypothetical protein
MRRYLVYFFISAVCTALGLAAINWTVDPYAIYQTHGLLEKNEVKPLLTLNERVFKTVRLAREKLDVIVLGTSRADIGIDPEHLAVGGLRSANLATFDQPMNETRRLFELASGQNDLKSVVIGLDFFTFNALRPMPSDFVADNFAGIRPVQLAFSVTTSLDSWKHHKQKTAQPGDCCYSNGARLPAPSPLGHYRSHFMNSEKMYLQSKYLPAPACKFDFSLPGSGQHSTLQDMRAVIALAHARNIALKLFVSPSHARQWEVIATAGLTEKWQEWKRELVRINVEEAARVHRSPFPLWDFSGYNAISSEAVPAEGDMKSRMRWYSDSSHYTLALGNLLLDRMAGVAAKELPDDFGVLLTPATLENQLAAIRRGHLAYRDTHPADEAEIAQAAMEAARRKYCAAESR